MPLAVPSHPARAENDFFRTIPGAKNVPAVLKYQQRFVDKVLSYTLAHEHVLYVIDNETAVTPKWVLSGRSTCGERRKSRGERSPSRRCSTPTT